MLYNVTLGDLKEVKEGGYDTLTWTLEESDRGSTFLENRTTYQRINIGKYVEGTISNTYMDLVKTEKGDSIGIACYEFPDNTRFVRYPNNYNIVLLNGPKKDKHNYNNDHAMFLTIMEEDYKLLSYDVIGGEEIIQTYKVKDKLKGCLIKFSMEGLDSLCIISIVVKDLKTNAYKRFEITCTKSVSNKAIVENNISVDVFDMKSKGDMKFIQKISKNKYPVTFKNTNKEGLVTQGYFIVNEKHREMIEDILDKQGSDIEPVIIYVDMKELDRDDKKFNDIKVIDIAQLLKSKNIRAVTAFMCHPPKNFCKDFNIKYMYYYDSKTGISSCRKSN